MIALWSAALWSAAALALAPPVTLTTEEAAKVAAREVLLRNIVTDSTTETVAVLDVRATPTAVMDAVMDLPARVGDIGALDSCSVYIDEPRRKATAWKVEAGPFTIDFHVMYQCNDAYTYCEFDLDRSKENDVDETAGSYQVYPHEGGTRLVYRAHSSSGYSAGRRLKQYFADQNSTAMLSGMRTRAEASP